MVKRRVTLDEFEDSDKYKLIAIHSSLEDFQLAYRLNQELNICLARKNFDIDFQKANYPIFEFNDKTELVTWHLVNNICKVEIGFENDISSLFDQEKSAIRILNLIPEYKEVKYLLKITYQTNFLNHEELISKLLSIPQIITAYEIEVSKLKSKTNLIFN